MSGSSGEPGGPRSLSEDGPGPGRRWLGRLAPPVTLALLAAVGGWSLWTVERAKTQELSNALETTLAANVTAMTLWLQGQETVATNLAHDPRVFAATAELLALRGPAGEDVPRSDLIASPASKALRAILGPPTSAQGYAGFVVVDRTGRTVGASEDASVGDRALAERSDAVGRALGGRAAVSRPFPAEVPLPNAEGRPELGAPTMLVAVPLRSARGEVLAALGVRIRPEGGFTQILQVARFGTTGETYAVDDRGRMLSQSRFDHQIRPLGLLGDSPGARSMLGLEIRDPGGDMTTGFRPTVERREQPLTKMAASLAAGRAGIDPVGYNDYRGVPVVGAWRWLPDYGMGVTTEVDVAEAFRPLWILRRTIWSLLGLLLVSYVANLLAARNVSDLTGRARCAERRVRQAELRARQLGQYTLEEKLGQGGMGAVYRASHAMLRRPTAIKLLSAVRPNVRELLRFEREVQLTSRLNHPNTITIFDFGRTPEGIFYYAMEYLPGIDLERLVRRFGPLPEARVIHLLIQVASALEEAHRMGLIHRDIKPANLMICERGGLYDFVKVLDFGLVREARNTDPGLTMAGSITGTPQYLSPEAIRNPDSADAQSDLYAVGAVAYFLLTGLPAFAGASAMEILSDHLSRDPTAPSRSLGRAIDPALESLVLACLAKKPADRPSGASDLLARLRQCSAFGAWTNEDARLWWAENRPQVPEPRPLGADAPADPPQSTEGLTITVSLNEAHRALGSGTETTGAFLVRPEDPTEPG